MEAVAQYPASERCKRKRKSPENRALECCSRSLNLDELNQDLLEQVLTWLPTSNFFRLTLVCKRWKSAANSPFFKLACSQIPSREPWYFMVDSQEPQFKNQPIIFDSADKSWRKLNLFPTFFQQKDSRNFVPVAASGGLICFMSSQFDFFVCNPLTGSCKELVSFKSASAQSINLQAISFISSPESYNLVLIHGELSELSFRIYSSKKHQWGEDAILRKKVDLEDSSFESRGALEDDQDDQAVYFLSKCGNVVSTNLQRSPCKQYSSVLIWKNGEQIAYFFSTSGRIIACNLTKKCYFEYPRLLPLYHEYSIDLVECGGEVYAVLLMEFLESSSLRVWKFDENAQSWDQVAAMPPAMSQAFYGNKVDINCSGADQQILVCLNSTEICSYFLCNLVGNEWIEVPKCHVNGEVKEFSCAFTFEPRIEASV